jgi:hypothetical protein
MIWLPMAAGVHCLSGLAFPRMPWWRLGEVASSSIRRACTAGDRSAGGAPGTSWNPARAETKHPKCARCSVIELPSLASSPCVRLSRMLSWVLMVPSLDPSECDAVARYRGHLRGRESFDACPRTRCCCCCCCCCCWYEDYRTSAGALVSVTA